jgi:hypothetical protein
MTARATRRIENTFQVFQELLLPQEITEDATPVVVYTSNIDIPQGRVLEIEVFALVHTTSVDEVSGIRKRGIYARETGESLRLVDDAKSDIIGEIRPQRADVIFGTNGNRFTISVRGRAATTYAWHVRLEVPRNN